MGEIVDRVTRKNQDLVSTLPLTISAQYGLIDQNEFFDKRVASKDVSGYYLVKKGEFAYNKSTSSDAPWGAIKRLDRYEKGVLSTLYIVFTINENVEVDSDYLVTYYDTDLWHRGVREIAAEGARNHGLLNIAPADFFETSLAIPQDIEEQKAIGKCFSELNTLITLHQRKKLRFRNNNTNFWEQRKLSELIEEYKETVESDCELPVLTSSKTEGVLLQEEHFGRKQSHDITGYNILPRNYCTYRNRSDGIDFTFNINKCCDKGIISKFYPVFCGKDNDTFFISLMLNNSDEVVHEIGYTCIGTGQKVLAFSDLLKMYLRVPTHEEQKKVANYFDKIDTLITLHQCKPSKLLIMIVNDWEQRKLNDIAEFSKGNGYSKGDLIESGTPIILYGRLYTKYETVISQVDTFVTPKEGSVYSKGGEIIVPASGESAEDIARASTVEKSGVLLGGDLNVMLPIEDVNSAFIALSISNGESQRELAKKAQGKSVVHIHNEEIRNLVIPFPTRKEQDEIVQQIRCLDNLITLHQRKSYFYVRNMVFAWEQRKLDDILQRRVEQRKQSEEYPRLAFASGQGVIPLSERKTNNREQLTKDEFTKKYLVTELDDIVYNPANVKYGAIDRNKCGRGLISPIYVTFTTSEIPGFIERIVTSHDFQQRALQFEEGTVTKRQSVNPEDLVTLDILVAPQREEQCKISVYFDEIDNLITLHQRKQKYRKNSKEFAFYILNTVKETKNMAELEAIIEDKLIEQLVYGDSQWAYRPDLKTEDDLWANFKYILEQNNKERLNGENLSESEFEQVKNQLQFSSFYKAGEWLVGENGKVMVHVQRDTERLHLVVMNHEHIAGGSSVYEVINQYSTLKTDEDAVAQARDRRFDVTLMINGLPMIHIELKNKQHSYMDGFWQIKKYIGEGKFTGIFSAVQMFVISNGVNTKYFSAANDNELNPKFISGWLDRDNNPVSDYIDFAKSVLKIPEAHEMVARYTVLDEDAKRLILLRPYQIHAIESIREASKRGDSGFVWHTTGSGKTLTSYKATRNLLMDIPAIDKTIFLIDRKDLDTQTTMAFQAYANNDLVDVDETENVSDLMKKLKSDDRQVIVTTIQKLHLLISKRLEEGTTEYNKIKSLKLAFVVDECHRAVTPKTKRDLERFFGNSLWFGFTGTPRFSENPYPQMGDLPRTTEDLYGECLHKYTIQNAIHDGAVLGFQVEHNGPKDMLDEVDSSIYDNEAHMLNVLNIILNRSYNKLGFQNGRGLTYEAILTTSSIQLAQKYYELLTRVKAGETTLKIDERVKQVLPDFPRFAITYSVSENEEGSQVNQEKMKGAINDYNAMFGTKFDIAQIQSYNANLNKRLARKDAKFKSRSEQLDLVIVVDRLLTGFDAPCMSTIFIDRQPMGPHDLIQAFSRTNRIYDKLKAYGQIVTFQAPKLFKKSVDNAIKLYSAGGTEGALLADWDEIEPAFRKSLSALRVAANSPADVPAMSFREKEVFAKMFQNFDKLFAQLKSFTKYDDSMLVEYGITQKEYDDYAGHYFNVLEEIKPGNSDVPEGTQEVVEVNTEYELMAYSSTKIDYEYIINLIQNIVNPNDNEENITPEEKQKKIEEVKQYVEELRKDNPKVADIMVDLIADIELDEGKYKGQSILNIVENMKHKCIDQVITDFCRVWYASKDDVMYAAIHYRNGEIPNESAIKATIDYTSYKATQESALPKFKYFAQMIAELRKTLEEEIKPLITH